LRTRSLHAWLGMALASIVVVPALAGAAGWLGAAEWQYHRERDREHRAVAFLRTAHLDTDAQRQAVATALSAIGVEAQLGPTKLGPKTEVVNKAEVGLKPIVVTPGLEGNNPKQELARYRQSEVSLPNVAGALYIRRESAATRWVVALGTGLAALVVAAAALVVPLRRWVLQPLAGLAADAERIAGGELDVEPLPTRVSEVAQVGDALRGMAGGLRDALVSSSAAERERRFMITAIAHDLRTPLFTLRGSLEAIERGVGDGRYLDRAQDKAAHLDHLVSDLFTFSRLEYASDTIAGERVDVATLVRRAADTVAPLAAARGCKLDLRGPPDDGLAVLGDAEALLRVLTNLLDNATRHGRGHVELRAQRSNGAVRFDVADDGPGFPPDDLPRVFDPLFRADRSRAAATGGSGLGLAIARRLARAQGGDVHAFNDPGGGARAIVTLPVASAD
jgi:signal transduction histidine kinase